MYLDHGTWGNPWWMAKCFKGFNASLMFVGDHKFRGTQPAQQNMHGQVMIEKMHVS
jgi:hypothetical protein